MVSHQTCDQTNSADTSMLTHTVTADNTDIVVDDDEDLEDYDENNTAVTYSFVLGDNKPLVVQSSTNEDQATEQTTLTQVTDDQTEDEDLVCEPIESKLVINFKPEDEVPAEEKKDEDGVTKDKQESIEETESEHEQNIKSKKSKLIDLLFGCFKWKKNKS